MKTYLTSLQKRKVNADKTHSIEYCSYTLSLSERISTWLSMLDDTARNQSFYEIDLCKQFRCRKEDLAIAMFLLNISSTRRHINGISVRVYSSVTTQHISDLSECQQFIYLCLKQGYITSQSEGWPSSIPCRILYEYFMQSEQYHSCSDRAFGRDVLHAAIARKRRSSGTVNVWNYDLQPLHLARKAFGEIVMCDENYKWE